MRFLLLTFLPLILVISASAAERPNVLVVLVDDLGFSDVGCYGSEIETPNLDRLAASGLRFSQFYNTAKCHSSRISLLTGCYAIQAGNTSLSRAVTSAEVLKKAGYSTMMAGKWHLKGQPTDFGFDRYFGHLSGACNYFTGDNTFRLNGKPWNVPADGFYTTVADVDYAIRFLDEARKEEDRPWYLYVAFNAPHAPLQPLKQDYRKYEGRYDIGWDKVRQARLAKQQKLGLFGQSVQPSPRPGHVRAWDAVTPKHRAFETKRMTAIAGLIDRVDQEVGRLIANLRRHGEMDNTLIVFLSDNGACPYDRRSDNPEADPFQASIRWSDSTGWAWARNSPFRYYKQNQYEGGIGTPAIVHWPAGLKTKPGSIVHDPAHLVDVLPTLAQVCEAPIPTTWPQRDVQPVSGMSLAPIFAGKPLGPRPPIHLLFGADRGLRDGDWKAVSFRSQPWELYNIASDRTELNDLAEKHPERLAGMVQRWTTMTKDVLAAPSRAYGPVADQATGHVHPEWTNFDLDPGGSTRKKKPGKTPTAGSADRIRARKDTAMKASDGELELTCLGDDPGIAIDHIRGPLPPGPYTLRFRLRSESRGGGEVFFTVDAKTKLPAGKHVDFRVTHDGQWQDIEVKLDTPGTLFALRLDPCAAPGKATIADLTLRSAQGKTLKTWPVTPPKRPGARGVPDR